MLAFSDEKLQRTSFITVDEKLSWPTHLSDCSWYKGRHERDQSSNYAENNDYNIKLHEFFIVK
jgi:hypothetical protein